MASGSQVLKKADFKKTQKSVLIQTNITSSVFCELGHWQESLDRLGITTGKLLIRQESLNKSKGLRIILELPVYYSYQKQLAPLSYCKQARSILQTSGSLLPFLPNC